MARASKGSEAAGWHSDRGGSDEPGRRAAAVKLLLDWGARVDGIEIAVGDYMYEDDKPREGRWAPSAKLVPLYEAVKYAVPGEAGDTVEILLAHGADVN